MKPRTLAMTLLVGTLLVCVSPGAQPGAQGVAGPGSVLAAPVSRHLSDTPWGSNVKVNDDPGSSNQVYPSIAVDSSGNAYAIWHDYRNGNWDIYFSYRPAGGSWGSNFKVNDDAGTKDQARPDIAVDHGGNAYAVWLDERNWNPDIYFAYRPAGGSWSANVKVNDDAGTAYQIVPAVAVDPTGNAHAAWEDWRNGVSGDIYSAYRPVGGAWGTNVKVNDDAGAASQSSPDIAVDPNGNAYAVWDDNRNGQADIYFSYRPAGGSWGSNVKANDDFGMSPSIAVDHSGNAYGIWDNPIPATNGIYFSFRPAGRSWGGSEKVNDDVGTTGYFSPSIAVDSGGNAYALWLGASVGNRDIYFSYRPFGGSWGADGMVNDDSGTAVYDDYPTIAVDPGGNAFALWHGAHNGNYDIYFSRLAASDARFLTLPFPASTGEGGLSSSLLEADPVLSYYYGSVRCFFDHSYPDGSTNDDITLSSGRTLVHGHEGARVRRDDCVWGRSCYDGHSGYDFTLPGGEAVLAAYDGVARYEWDYCYGHVIRVDHQNGYETFYGHLRPESLITRDPSQGVAVSRGQRVGLVGNTGECIVRGPQGDGSHLHFTVFRDLDGDGGETGEEIDPFGWNALAGPDPWVEQGGPTSACLWTFGCSGQNWVTPGDGGYVTSPDGDVVAQAPAGAVDLPAMLRLTITPDPVADASAVPTGYSFDIRARDIYGALVSTFSQPLTVVIEYAESIVDFLVEESLQLFFWDDENGTWNAVDTVVDVESNTATAEVTHLSLFALRGEPLYDAPSISMVEPAAAYSHVDGAISIHGENFVDLPSARIGGDALYVTFVNSSTLTAVVPSGLDPGTYDLTVTNPDAQEGSLGSCFTVLEPLCTRLPLVVKNY